MTEKLLRFCFRRTVNRIENQAAHVVFQRVYLEIQRSQGRLGAFKKFTSNYYAWKTAEKILGFLGSFSSTAQLPTSVFSYVTDAVFPAVALDLSFRTVTRKPSLKKIAQQEMKEEVQP